MSRLTHTPRYHAWLERLRAATAPAGAKTELATFMAGERAQSIPVWKVNISRILHSPDRIINAEDLLSISSWMESRRPAKKRVSQAPRPVPRA